MTPDNRDKCCERCLRVYPVSSEYADDPSKGWYCQNPNCQCHKVEKVEDEMPPDVKFLDNWRNENMPDLDLNAPVIENGEVPTKVEKVEWIDGYSNEVEDWEEEFDEKFDDEYLHDKPNGYPSPADKLKSFISNLLKAQRTALQNEVKEKVRGLREYYWTSLNKSETIEQIGDQIGKDGYNQALRDIENLDSLNQSVKGSGFGEYQCGAGGGGC